MRSSRSIFIQSRARTDPAPAQAETPVTGAPLPAVVPVPAPVLPVQGNLMNAMANARHTLLTRIPVSEAEQDHASGLMLALEAVAGRWPSAGGAHSGDFLPPVREQSPVSTLSSGQSPRSIAAQENLQLAQVGLQTPHIPQAMRSIIAPVMQGVGRRFPENHAGILVGLFDPRIAGNSLGKTLRIDEMRTAVVSLNPDVSADVGDTPTYADLQGSYAATLAHEILLHAIPYMRALASGREEEDDDTEHRRMFMPPDIDANAYHAAMVRVRDCLPLESRRQFMQSYADSVGSHIDRLSGSDDRDANDFLADLIIMHDLK